MALDCVSLVFLLSKFEVGPSVRNTHPGLSRALALLLAGRGSSVPLTGSAPVDGDLDRAAAKSLDGIILVQPSAYLASLAWTNPPPSEEISWDRRYAKRRGGGETVQVVPTSPTTTSVERRQQRHAYAPRQRIGSQRHPPIQICTY